MSVFLFRSSLLFILVTSLLARTSAQTVAVSPTFEELRYSASWKPVFKDSGTRNWRRNWFLDGLRATVVNSPEGMIFSGGPQERDDACHGVLWTRKSFSGDLKIEYTYTRTDTRTKWVNILYIQATGANDRPADITAWNADRIIPSMRTYFNQMNALHISYAAISEDSTGQVSDYIRARKYPVPAGTKFRDTNIKPDYFDTELFRPGVPYRITVIKTKKELFFNVEGDGKEQCFHWLLSADQPITEGRIGLRHMYTRSARYGDFRIWERP